MITQAEPTQAMELDRAESIVAALNNCSMWTILNEDRFAADVKLLDSLSLQECLDAVATVRQYGDRKREIQKADGKPQSFQMLPDDRLVAAAFTLAQYGTGNEPIVAVPTGKGMAKALGVVSVPINEA
jgi:hypothetical protein